MKRSDVWLADLLGLAVLLGAASLVVFYWVAPNRAQAERQPVVSHQAARLRATLAQQEMRRTTLAERRDQRIRSLNAQYMRLPAVNDLSTYVSALGETAEVAGIWLEELSPGTIETAGPFAIANVQLKAKGSFSDFVRWLEGVSRTMPNLDVAQLTINGGGATDASGVRLSWTARILMRNSDEGPMTAATVAGESPRSGAPQDGHE